MCGSPYALSRQSFRIARSVLDLPVCPSCWKRHVGAGTVVKLACGVAAVAILGSVVVAFVSNALSPLLVGGMVALGALLGASLCRRRHEPKRVAGEGLVIDVPNAGRVRVK